MTIEEKNELLDEIIAHLKEMQALNSENKNLGSSFKAGADTAYIIAISCVECRKEEIEA